MTNSKGYPDVSGGKFFFQHTGQFIGIQALMDREGIGHIGKERGKGCTVDGIDTLYTLEIYR